MLGSSHRLALPGGCWVGPGGSHYRVTPGGTPGLSHEEHRLRTRSTQCTDEPRRGASGQAWGQAAARWGWRPTAGGQRVLPPRGGGGGCWPRVTEGDGHCATQCPCTPSLSAPQHNGALSEELWPRWLPCDLRFCGGEAETSEGSWWLCEPGGADVMSLVPYALPALFWSQVLEGERCVGVCVPQWDWVGGAGLGMWGAGVWAGCRCSTGVHADTSWVPVQGRDTHSAGRGAPGRAAAEPPWTGGFPIPEYR